LNFTLFISMFFDPILLVAVLFLIFSKLIRKNFIIYFCVVAALHILLLTQNPVKDSFWFTFLFTRLLIDGIMLLGLGFLLNAKNNKKKLKQADTDK
jgi:hypothetical protein